jgi:hypothetical protein
MAIINSGSFAKALWPGVNKWYGDAYNEFPVEWSQLFEHNKSTRAFEEDVGTTGLGLPRVKAEGAPIEFDTAKQGFTTRYQHVVYGLGFIVTREAFDDDQYDVVGKKRAQALAYSMRQGKEVVGANVFNRAFTSTYSGGDGKELCSSAHVNVTGGTWSNIIATAADISEAALEQAVIDIQTNYLTDRGLRIAVMPKALLITPQQEFDVMRILKSDGRVDTANNDMNVLKTLGSIPKVIKNHYLTDADAWFVLTNVPDGLKYWERRADSFDTDNDWDTENAKFKATARYSFGWTDPRCIYGSAGA